MAISHHRHPAVAPSAPHPALPEHARPGLTAPAVVVELWLDHDPVDLRLGVSRAGRVYRSALGVVRADGRVLGAVVLGAESNGVIPAARIDAALAPYRAGAAAGFDGKPIDSRGPEPATVAAVVTGNGDADRTVRAVGSILRGTLVPDQVVVVDTGGSPDVVSARLREWFPTDGIRVIHGEGAGRALARNVGLQHVTCELVVFADDGLLADRDWLERLVDALTDTDADTAVGQSLPFDLDHPVHVELAELTGATAGIYRRSIHRASHVDDPSPIDPAISSGTRRTLLVRAGAIRELDGFDTHLGAGTAARGGEDLDLIDRLLDTGGTLVHDPAAIAWFANDRTTGDLRREAFGRGVALGALLTKRITTAADPVEAMRGIPDALREVLFPPGMAPSELLRHDLHRVHLAGLGLGPLAFARSRITGTPRSVMGRPTCPSSVDVAAQADTLPPTDRHDTPRPRRIELPY